MKLEKKRKKERKPNGYLADIGKLFVDIAKLSFGGLVIGSVIRWDIPQMAVFAAGFIFSAIIALLGIHLARRYRED